MSPIHEWGINLILFLQSTLPWLRAPMTLLTFLGEEEFFFLLLPVLYWCVNAQLGARVGALVCMSGSVNYFFKLLFHDPRPYWLSNKVHAWRYEATYGLPSGHAQHSTVTWGALAAAVRGPIRWVMVALIVLVGFSRIVLGVHFPTDVLLGWLIGGVVLWVVLRFEKPVVAWFRRFPIPQQLGLAFLASMVLLAIPLSGLLFAPPAVPSAWIAAVQILPGAEPLTPNDTTGFVTAAASFFGMVAGLIVLSTQFHFDAGGPWLQRVLRFAVGIVIVLILWLGIKAIIPDGQSLVALVLRYVRYTLIGFWIAFGAPWTFARLGLCQVKGLPQPAASSGS